MSEESCHYKFLDDSFTGGHTNFTWPIGEWVEVKGELKLCENGLHILKPTQITPWIRSQLYECEVEGEILEADDKLCARKVRLIRKLEGWNTKTHRLFATDCAERVLKNFETTYPDDDRVRKAIEAARAFAGGEIGEDELNAARSAARSAYLAAWAARSAARSAYSAADSAARSAADSAYSAADSAARSAADSAYSAAWAARSAARSAYSAADSAAYLAEREWQCERLLDYAYGSKRMSEEMRV